MPTLASFLKGVNNSLFTSSSFNPLWSLGQETFRGSLTSSGVIKTFYLKKVDGLLRGIFLQFFFNEKKNILLKIFFFFLALHVLSHFSHVQVFATLWTVARQASLSMGFFRQYWSGLLCLLPNPEIEPTSLTSPVLAGGFFTTSTTWEAPLPHTIY